MKNQLMKSVAILTAVTGIAVSTAGPFIDHYVSNKANVTVQAESEDDKKEENKEEENKEESNEAEVDERDDWDEYALSEEEIEEMSNFIREFYKDYDYKFNPLDHLEAFNKWESSDEEIEEGEEENALLDMYQEILGDQTFPMDYDEKEMYKETKDGVAVKDLIPELILELLEDVQKDRLYIYDTLEDNNLVDQDDEAAYNAVLEELGFSQQLTDIASNQLLGELTEYSTAFIEAEKEFFKALLEETDIEIDRHTDMNELDDDVLEKILESEALNDASSAINDEETFLSFQIMMADTPEAWEKLLEDIQNTEFVEELSGKELNEIGEALNQARVYRIMTMSVLDRAIEESHTNDQEESATEEGVDEETSEENENKEDKKEDESKEDEDKKEENEAVEKEDDQSEEDKDNKEDEKEKED